MTALIFDCDGVLVDSEILACTVNAEVLTSAGFILTLDDVLDRFVGRSVKSMHEELEREQRKRVPDWVHNETEHRIQLAFKNKLNAVSGAANFLKGSTLQRCVASSSEPVRLRNSLDITKLTMFFEPHIYSASMVTNGKPAPDLFLYAAKRIGVLASECIVLEDSIYGIQAALAAGMIPVGFLGGSHCRSEHAEKLELAGAVVVVKSFEDFQQWLSLRGL